MKIKKKKFSNMKIKKTKRLLMRTIKNLEQQNVNK